MMNDDLDHIQNYTSGCRVVMLINRGVNNSHKGSKRWLRKLISFNEEQLFENIKILQDCQNEMDDPNIRLYMSLNSRNFTKAIHMFLNRTIENSFFSDEILKERFYGNLNDQFISCLMKPENRESKYYLIDYDFKDPSHLDYILNQNGLIPESKYQTPNGHHYIMKKFNVKLVEAYSYEVKKDGLILI